MNVFEQSVSDAFEVLEKFGMDVVIRKDCKDEPKTSVDQADFGFLMSEGNVFSFELGGINEAVSPGDTIRFKDINTYKNRGPFEVVNVTQDAIEVDAELDIATEDHWLLEIVEKDVEMASGIGLPLPPRSGTGQAYDQDYRDGTLQIGNAQDLVLAAKGLKIRPRKGHKVQLNTRDWKEDIETWIIHGMSAYPHDFEPVVYMGAITKG
jgi:hypothetical protein